MKKVQWLLVGGETLLGKEISDLVEERKLPVVLRTAAGTSKDPVLTAEEDEIAVVEPLSAELLEDAEVVLLGGTAENNREALLLARGLERKPAFVDLEGGFEDLPESVLRAPLLEEVAPKAGKDALHVPAHPAAAALARVLLVLHQASPLKAAVATVLEPASEYGKAGIDELHKQSVNLFNFQPMPKELFDAQASFNLLPRYGAEAKASLGKNEQRMERHLASLLGARGVPLPSIRVVHAPVFHGYCLSVWVEFAGARPAAAEALAALSRAGMDARGEEAEPGSNADVAGQSGITVSDVAEDRNSAKGLWLWVAFDNLRAVADEALLIAGLLTKERGAA